jgi:hypothetical protein
MIQLEVDKVVDLVETKIRILHPQLQQKIVVLIIEKIIEVKHLWHQSHLHLHHLHPRLHHHHQTHKVNQHLKLKTVLVKI